MPAHRGTGYLVSQREAGKMVYCCNEQGRFTAHLNSLWNRRRHSVTTCPVSQVLLKIWKSISRLASVGGEVGWHHVCISRWQDWNVQRRTCAVIQLTRNYENSFQRIYSGFHSTYPQVMWSDDIKCARVARKSRRARRHCSMSHSEPLIPKHNWR